MLAFAKQIVADFQRHNDAWLAAAIAYFTIFAIAPLVIVIVEIAGGILGEHENLLHALHQYLSGNAGEVAATGVDSIVSATFNRHREGAFAQMLAWIVFVAAAIGLFGSIQQALNVVWEVTAPKQRWRAFIRSRLASFGAVVVVALLLLVSVSVNTGLTVAEAAAAHISPALPAVLKAIDFIFSFAGVTLLFALLYRYLPDCYVAWRDVFAGAALTGLLFVVGQFLLGWYLGRTGISSTYGAFGGLVVFLVWVDYSAQVFLVGAEFTHVYAGRRGSRAAQL